MTMRNRRSTIEDVHSLFHLGAMGAWADGKLVSHFVSGQSGREGAFRVLLHRHGPMVLSACRRILGDSHSAEDAFQATFLVLVKKAGSIRDGDVLTGWLYSVALRVSRKAKAQADRRRVVESRAAERSEEARLAGDPGELRSMIDEEIRRLPERYREPLILCYLEGLRHHEIAERLDCPLGTVESRLSRGREQLRSRLVRRGLAPTAAIQGVMLVASDASASVTVPTRLVEMTIRSVAAFVSRRIVAEAASAATLAGAASWPSFGMVMSGLVACVGIIGGLGAYRPWALGAAPEDPTGGVEVAENRSDRAPSPVPVVPAEPPAPPTPPPEPSRPDSATAGPLANITIDGRLDDWPIDLERHRISRRYVGSTGYDREPRAGDADPLAYFLAGFDPKSQRIYLAVVVRDDDLVAKAGDHIHTDAVEVYVEGYFSERTILDAPLRASMLPVVQYAAVPGPVPAYSDPNGSNPSLVYGNLKDTTTAMAYHREGDVTTYEWAVQVFDRYPDRPTRLEPGNRIGLDVVVVDKDRDREKPSWMHWGPPPTHFKGQDASLLGELILVDRP